MIVIEEDFNIIFHCRERDSGWFCFAFNGTFMKN